MRNIRGCLVLSLVLAVCAAAFTQERIITEYRIGPKDLLEISVFGVADLNKTVRVSEDGKISLPLVGEVSIEGMTKTEVERTISGLLQDKYIQNPQVTVFIREYQSKKVSVIGAVGTPGPQEMLGRQTLLQIISQAGGITNEAGDEIIILRELPDGTGTSLHISIEDLIMKGDAKLNVPLEPNDVISIPIDKTVKIYVFGQVRNPGALDVRKSRIPSLLQAIAQAGGFSDRASKSSVVIKRKDGAGKEIKQEVNVKDVIKGKKKDIQLLENDVDLCAGDHILSEGPEAAAGGLVDLHCHILPGLDDGAAGLETSLAMARKAAADGVGTIVATPHVFRDGLDLEDPGAIGRKCKELNEALGSNGIPVRVLPGAEVHVSHDLLSEIRAHKDVLAINGSPYICVEFPEDLVFSGTRNLFFELMGDGMTPIIAHPERNSVFGRDPGALYELIRMGALAQGNAGSLSGRYGLRAQEALRIFLKSNLIHFLASDAHDDGESGSWLSGAVRRATALVGRARALAMARENPMAVICGKAISDLPSPVSPEGVKKSLKIRIPNILRPNR